MYDEIAYTFVASLIGNGTYLNYFFWFLVFEDLALCEKLQVVDMRGSILSVPQTIEDFPFIPEPKLAAAAQPLRREIQILVGGRFPHIELIAAVRRWNWKVPCIQ